MKRILATLLMLVVLLGTVACSPKEEDEPDNYMLVSLEDEIFNLYIPKSWQNNSASGVSGGYASLASRVMASASTITLPVDMELSDLATSVVESYKGTLEEFEQVTELEETTLGSFAAYKFDYTTKSMETTMKFRCVLAKNQNTLTTLSCCAPEADFDTHATVFDEIASFFTFREFEDDQTDGVILKDENTPDGFFLASRAKDEFRFYVPDTWTVDMTGGLPKATYSKTDFSNVTLSSYAVQEGVTNGKEYWNVFKNVYSYDITEVSSDENAKMGGYDAYAIEYITDFSGIKFYTKQVFLATPSLIYIFTYTSDSIHYEDHLADVDTMLSMFEFKK